jgi:hypothetical protein
MNTSKSIILTIISLIAIAIVIFVSQLLLSKHRTKASSEGKLNVSFAIKFVSVFIAFSIIMANAIKILGEAVDNIFKSKPQNVMSEIIQVGSLYIGLSTLWFLVWYYISAFLGIAILGNRNEVNEIESDHYSYFLIKGGILLGLVICLSIVFEILLRSFLPNVELPFYH